MLRPLIRCSMLALLKDAGADPARRRSYSGFARLEGVEIALLA